MKKMILAFGMVPACKANDDINNFFLRAPGQENIQKGGGADPAKKVDPKLEARIQRLERKYKKIDEFAKQKVKMLHAERESLASVVNRIVEVVNGKAKQLEEIETKARGPWKHCADQLKDEKCECEGIVRYGAEDKYAYRMIKGEILCESDHFWNPIRGVHKSCSCAPKKDMKESEIDTFCDWDENTMTCKSTGKKVPTPATENPDSLVVQDAKKKKKGLLDEDAIIVTKTDVKWDDIVGLEEAKHAMQSFAEMPLNFPHFFEGENALDPYRGILLYGPPGTGKTYLAKALANANDAVSFLSVSSADLMGKYVGDSPKMVRELFEIARQNSPAVVFIDELEQLLARRTSGAGEGAGTNVRREVLSEFLIQMDGVGNLNDGVVVVGATNRPWDMDPAVLSRFQKKIYVPLPEEDSRLGILRKLLDNVLLDKKLDGQLPKIAKHTENFSARDLKALVQEARQQTVLDLKRASKWRKMRPHPSNENLDYALVPLQSGSVGSQTGEIVEMTFAEAKVDKAVSVRLILPPMELEHFTRALERHPVVVPSRDLKRLDAWSKSR